MLTRYLVTRGARTTAGGTVVAATSCRSIDGVKVAIEDDPVDCPACKSVGVIKPDGPRLRETFNGKQVALHDDLCICKCVPPPRLIANQTLVRQQIDAEWQAAEIARKTAGLAADDVAARDAADAGASMPLLLLDAGTKQPFRHRPYRLALAGGVIEGTTDEHGATRPLTPAERKSIVAWHVSE